MEVQVRTDLQDLWAQVFECLGDRWGRAIRYGGDPDQPDAVALAGDPAITRREVVQVMQRLSDDIDRVEAATLDVLDVEDAMIMYLGDRDEEEYLALAADQRELRAAMIQLKAKLTYTLTSFLQYATREA